MWKRIIYKTYQLLMKTSNPTGPSKPLLEIIKFFHSFFLFWQFNFFFCFVLNVECDSIYVLFLIILIFFLLFSFPQMVDTSTFRIFHIKSVPCKSEKKKTTLIITLKPWNLAEYLNENKNELSPLGNEVGSDTIQMASL